MIPIGDEPSEGGTPYVNYALIAANVLAFVFVQGMGTGPDFEASMVRYAYVPTEASVFTSCTSMFMHASWMHLLGNMLFLWIFGDNVEARLGRVGYLAAYLATGLFAGGAHGLSDVSPAIPSLGASGAISGVQGMYLVAFPRNRVKLLVFFYFVVRVIRVPALGIMLFWFVLNDLLPTVLARGGSMGGGVAHMAHIGGFVSGILLLFLMRSAVQAVAPPGRAAGASGWGIDAGGSVWGNSRGPQRWDGGGRGGFFGGGSRVDRTSSFSTPIEVLSVDEQILALWRSGRFSEGAAALAAALRAGARVVLPEPEFLRLSSRLYDEAHYDDAKAAFTAYLRQHPTGTGPAVAAFALGVIASRRDGDVSTARSFLRIAERGHPDPASRAIATRELDRLR